MSSDKNAENNNKNHLPEMRNRTKNKAGLIIWLYSIQRPVFGYAENKALTKFDYLKKQFILLGKMSFFNKKEWRNDFSPEVFYFFSDCFKCFY